MYIVYALKSERGPYIYKGLTKNIIRRLEEHNLGRNKSTKAKGPFSVIYTEEVETRLEAREREKWLKSGEGREFLKSLIPG